MLVDTTKVRIDSRRLWTALKELAEVGGYDDPATGLRGVNRLALTDADAAARRLVLGWMTDAGLAVSVDEMGNLFGRREGTDPSLSPVLAGSHIDSVPTAGAFDGCLGVLGALEAVRALAEAGVRTRRPLVVAVWTEEEGVRFGTDMLGSAVAAGRLGLEEAYGLVDRDGLRLVDELERIGFRGSDSSRLPPPHAYVECHIEQGPVLEHEGLPIGVVTGVQGISWQRIVLHGRAAHAGTTPTELRVDAGVAAAEVVLQVRRMAESGDYGQLRGTVGRLQAFPGMANVVPHRVELTVDLRNPDDAAQARAEADLSAFLARLAERTPGLWVESTQLARTTAVSFSENIMGMISEAAGELGLPHRRMMSGAGHDAQEIADIAPAGMIFVRGRYDGISHNPREYSTPEDCAAGVTVLAHVLARLAS